MPRATTPSQPPAAPHRTSIAFQTTPSCDPRAAWTTSIAAEYTATASAALSPGRVLGPSALSAVNPTSAKAAMLYVLRSTMWNESMGGDVRSYTSLLVAAQNSAAATATAAAIQNRLAPSDRESS
jgi:hypothetical protein